MPPAKRKVAAVFEDDDPEDGDGGGGAASQAPLAVDMETADAIANKLCRFVLLREHLRKPVSRADMKSAVMNEHNDRSGKVFKQVLALANDKLKEIAGLELVLEAASAEDDGDVGGGTQAAASQAGASQAGPSQAAGPGKAPAAKTNTYIIVNRLPNPVRTEESDSASAYYAFVEVVLCFLQQSDGMLEEEKLFHWLEQVGLERKGAPRARVLPDPAPPLPLPRPHTCADI